MPIGWMHPFVAHRIESDALAEIGGIVVSQKLRGTGIGMQILRKAEEWARPQRVRGIRVRSTVVRERAHDFYERAGYKQIKT